MKVVSAALLFVMWMVFGNLAVWIGSWAITHLGKGVDAVVMFSAPLVLFIVPALVMKKIAKSRGLTWMEVDGKKRSPSLLLHCGDSMLALGIVCALMLLFACPASAKWLQLLTGGAAEETTIEAALGRHREVMYLSFKDAQVLDIVGSERQPTSGRDNTARDYAAPIVARFEPGSQTVLTKATAVAKYQPFMVWLGADLKRDLDALVGTNRVFGGVVLRGGSYRQAVQRAITANRLTPVPQPMIVELGAPTFAGQLAQEGPWAWLGLGVFNALLLLLAGMSFRSMIRR